MWCASRPTPARDWSRYTKGVRTRAATMRMSSSASCHAESVIPISSSSVVARGADSPPAAAAGADQVAAGREVGASGEGVQVAAVQAPVGEDDGKAIRSARGGTGAAGSRSAPSRSMKRASRNRCWSRARRNWTSAQSSCEKHPTRGAGARAACPLTTPSPARTRRCGDADAAQPALWTLRLERRVGGGATAQGAGGECGATAAGAYPTPRIADAARQRRPA
jgi:hypothetical protein